MLKVRILFRTPASYYEPRESHISKGWHVWAYKNTLVEHLYMKPVLDGRLFFTVLSFMEPNDDEIIRSLKVSAADVLAELSGSSQPHHGSLTSLRQRIRRTITSADDGRRDVRVVVCVCCTALCAVHRTDLTGSKSSDPVLFLLHRPQVTSYTASIAWFSALSISNLWIHPLPPVGEIVLSQIPSFT